MRIPFELRPAEVEFCPIRAQGAGGQNVNKVSSAVQLRFDIGASTLPEPLKERLLALRDQRLSSEGVLVIKAQNHRSQERNRADALHRLLTLIESAAELHGTRRPTRPTAGAKRRRLETKARHGALKRERRRVDS